MAVGSADKAPYARSTKDSVRIKMGNEVPYEVDGGERKKVRTLRVDVEPAAVEICVGAGTRL